VIRVWGLPLTGEETKQLAGRVRALLATTDGASVAFAARLERAIDRDEWLVPGAEEAGFLFRATDAWLSEVGEDELGEILTALRAEAEARAYPLTARS
jgi:hypothetical protein